MRYSQNRRAGSPRHPLIALVVAAALWAPALAAQELTALARVLPEATELREAADGVEFDLGLSQPVPWRVRTLDDPPRLVLDFREVDFARFPALAESTRVPETRHGVLRDGWSRLVLRLDGPYELRSAAMQTAHDGDAAVIALRLDPTDPESFARAAAEQRGADAWSTTRDRAARPPEREGAGEGPLTVVLDPGHGGIDPGAERDGITEAELMLTFARELREALLRAGGFEVVLTREDDVFVSLEGRVRIARAANADVFLSLHADALPGGGASGATVYTLAEEATDAASAALAERHDRADLLAGVDLRRQDDLVAGVLMSIARNETAPRTDALADALVGGITDAVGRMHRRPRQAAGFSVLKAPDIPAVLVELGFMSSETDLANLRDPDWRADFAQGVVHALQAWALEDAAEAPLRRR